LHSFAMKRTEAASLRDALTGASIDTSAKIWRCLGCQSMYHDQSIEALRRDRRASCVNCPSSRQVPVTLSDD
jgi:hypothetical protein